MGCDSYILTIGPFSRDIIEYMDYDEDWYGDNEGAMVTARFGDMPTTGTSSELADILGVKMKDVTTHCLNVSTIDWSEVISFGYFEDVEIEGMLALAARGFMFFFMPEC